MTGRDWRKMYLFRFGKRSGRCFAKELGIPEWETEKYRKLRDYCDAAAGKYQDRFQETAAYHKLGLDENAGVFCLHLSGESLFFELKDLEDYHFSFVPEKLNAAGDLIEGKTLFEFQLTGSELNCKTVLAERESCRAVLREPEQGTDASNAEPGHDIREGMAGSEQGSPAGKASRKKQLEYDYPEDLQRFEEQFLLARLRCAELPD